MNRLIFISCVPISKNVGCKIEYESLEKLELDLEYWNLSELYFAKEKIEYYSREGGSYLFPLPNEIKFKNKKEVKSQLDVLESSKVVFYFFGLKQYDDFWLLREFKKRKLRYMLAPKRTPFINSSLDSMRIIRKVLAEPIITLSTLKKRATRWVKEYIYQNSNFYMKPSLAITSGELGKTSWSDLTQAEKNISIPSSDLVWNSKLRPIDEKFCVYVEDTIFYSPDLSFERGVQRGTCLDTKTYLNRLKKIFEMVEEKYQAQVVVACSGKTIYSDKTIYHNRELIYGETLNLIYHSDFVFGHDSSALLQAMVKKTPMLLMLDETLYYKKNNKTQDLANFFGINAYHMSSINKKLLDNIEIEKRIKDDENIRKFFSLENIDNSNNKLVVNEINDLLKKTKN